MIDYTAKDFKNLLGMQGFSDTLLNNHFTLYNGYVTNVNKLNNLLTGMLRDGKVGSPEYNELRRHMGFEFDGMRLHEYYFENLGGKEQLDKSGTLGKRLSQDYESYLNP